MHLNMVLNTNTLQVPTASLLIKKRALGDLAQSLCIIVSSDGELYFNFIFCQLLTPSLPIMQPVGMRFGSIVLEEDDAALSFK